MQHNEYSLLFSNSGTTRVQVKFQNFNGTISTRKMNPEEITQLISSDGRGFISSMTFDEWLFEVYKYEIDPIGNTLTIYARQNKDENI